MQSSQEVVQTSISDRNIGRYQNPNNSIFYDNSNILLWEYFYKTIIFFLASTAEAIEYIKIFSL